MFLSYPNKLKKQQKIPAKFYFSWIRSQLDSSTVCITTTLSTLFLSDLLSAALHYKLTPRVCKYKYSEVFVGGLWIYIPWFWKTRQDFLLVTVVATVSWCRYHFSVPWEKGKHLRKAGKVLKFHNTANVSCFSLHQCHNHCCWVGQGLGNINSTYW